MKYIIEQYVCGQTIAEETATLLEERLKKTFTRIRLGVRTSEQNSIVIKDTLNTLLYEFPSVEFCMPARGDTEHKVISESELAMKERIRKYKQRKDNSLFDTDDSWEEK